MFNKIQNIRVIIGGGILLFMSAFASLALGEDRNVAVDQTIGGMEQGRRIPSPGSYSNKGITSGKPGSTTGSVTDRHTVLQESEKVTASSHGKNNNIGGNHGFIYVREQANNPQNATNQAAGQQTNVSTSGAGQTASTEANGSNNIGNAQGTEPTSGSANVNTGETTGGQTQTSGLPAGQAGSVNVNTGEVSTANPANGGGQTSGSIEVNTLPTGTEQTGGSVETGTTQPTTGQTTVNTGSSGTTPTVSTETSSTGQVGTGETHTGSGSSETTTESSGTSNNPIVGVDANVNPNTGTVDAGVHTDTSGQLEDRQIIDAGVTAGQTGSTGTQTGSASEITGSETIHQTDVTTQPVTQTTQQVGTTAPNTTETNVGAGNGGILVGGETSPTGQVGTGETHTGSGSSETTTESSGTSSNPIVGVDANVNPNTGTVDAGVHTDTSGQLEDRQIIDAGVTAGQTGSTGTQTGSASEITGSEAVHQTDITTQPVTETTGQTGTGEITTGTGNGGIFVGGETSATGQVGIGETHTENNSGTATQESSSGTSNPIVGVEAGVDQSSGMPNAGVTVDTSGQLEEREILDADLTGETTGSTGAEVGSAADITDSDLVEEADITTEVVSGATGQTVPNQIGGSTNGGTGSGSQTPTQESSGTSSHPIVDLETNIHPESGTAEVNVGVDTSGELEDRQILQLDLTADGIASTDIQTGSASSITGSETVHDTNVAAPVTTTEQTVRTTAETQTGPGEVQTSGTVESLIPAPSDFGVEIDTTGQTAGGEADVGIAAEVDGVSEGADVGRDPADGLSTAVPGL